MTVLLAALIGWAVVALGASALFALVVRTRNSAEEDPGVGWTRVVPAAPSRTVLGDLDAAAEAAADAAEQAQRAARAAQGPADATAGGLPQIPAQGAVPEPAQASVPEPAQASVPAPRPTPVVPAG